MIKQIQKKLQADQNILAVSKLQPTNKILELYNLGQRHFGENYVQEAIEKIDQLADKKDISWHLIGPLQKNKVKYLKNKFSYIHSVDSVELAEIIHKKSFENNFRQKVFIQINLAHESTKSGLSQTDFEKSWENLKKLTSLEIVGLMTMPPLQNEAEQNRKYFKRLKNLAVQCQLKELSMGTSHDYQVALDEGATWIRLGTILFGERTTIK